MSIEQPLLIDRIAKRPGGREIALIITDHLRWEEQGDHHEDLMLHKLGNYVAFFESGRVLEEYPDSGESPVWIEVIAQHSLTNRAIEFFLSVRAALAEKGLRFDVKAIDDSGRLSESLLPSSQSGQP
jgi:hypothetical protein